MRRILTFVHIEKAAGTTLIHILRRNFPVAYMDVRPFTKKPQLERWFPSFAANDLKIAMRINPFLKCMTSHAICPQTDFSAVARLDLVTLLRNPVDRYISQYYYSRERRGKTWTFEQFLDLQENRNFQVRKIAGSDDLELAKATLHDKFVVVGVVEKFDEFLFRMRESVASKKLDIAYEKANERPTSKGKVEILEKYSDRIASLNALDIELYEYAVANFCGTRSSIETEAPDSEVNARALSAADRIGNAANYMLRKCYLEPVTNVVRRVNGIEPKGSYAVPMGEVVE